MLNNMFPHSQQQPERIQGVKRNSTGSIKVSKPMQRPVKRPSSSSNSVPRRPSVLAPSSQDSMNSHDSKHKRVWKACERCRMKKTKCDGEFPCRRCKDDGLVCTAGTRKKLEYKQLPKGYAEVLEVTQIALVATVHKLYNMVREGQSWDLGEPEFNGHGLPVIHDIANRLGAIRPNADIDLPVQSVFPESREDLAHLVTQLEAHEQHQASHYADEPESENASSCDGETSVHAHDATELESFDMAATDGHISASLSPAGFESYDTVFGEMNDMSPVSLAYDSFDDYSSVSDRQHSTSSPTDPSRSFGSFHQVHWLDPTKVATAEAPAKRVKMMHAAADTTPCATNEQIIQTMLRNAAASNTMLQLYEQGLVDMDTGRYTHSNSNDALGGMMQPEVMLSMDDPMIYTGYDGEPLGL